MKPLNDSAKKKATNKFIGVYASSLLVTLLCAYFWFFSPGQMFKDQLKKSQDFMAEHDSIVTRTNLITSLILSLKEIERKGINSAQDQSSVDDYLDKIGTEKRRLGEDTDKLVFPTIADNLKNHIAAYEMISIYGIESNGLRQKLSAAQMAAKPGDNGLMDKYTSLLREKTDLEARMNQLLNAKGNSGGGAPANAAELEKCKRDYATLEAERNDLRTAKAAADEKIKQQDAALKNAGNTGAVPVAAGCTEADKARVMFASVEAIYAKAQSDKKEKRGYYYAALEILKNPSMSAYPDQAKVVARKKDINEYLNPIGNN